MLHKRIQILTPDGNPAQDVLVLYDDGTQGLTDASGFVKVHAYGPGDWIAFSSVQGEPISFQFGDLPNVITLDVHELPPFTVTPDSGKKKTWPWLVLGGLGLMAVLGLKAEKKPKPKPKKTK